MLFFLTCSFCHSDFVKEFVRFGRKNLHVLEVLEIPEILESPQSEAHFEHVLESLEITERFQPF